MQNGGWMIVIVIIMLALVTGFLVSNNQTIWQQKEIGDQALVNSVMQLATANAKATADTQEMDRLRTEVAVERNQAVTATAQQGACVLENEKTRNELKNSQASKAQADGIIQSQQATLIAMGDKRIPLSGGDSQQVNVVSTAHTTATPINQINMGMVGVRMPWLPILAVGFFGTVVISAYRMLKIEDQAQGPTR